MAQLPWHTSVSILVAGGLVAGAVYLALRPSASPEPSKDAFDTDGWNAAKYRAAIFAAFVAAADSVAAGPDA